MLRWPKVTVWLPPHVTPHSANVYDGDQCARRQTHKLMEGRRVYNTVIWETEYKRLLHVRCLHSVDCIHAFFLFEWVCVYVPACVHAYAGVGGSSCGWSPGVLWGMMFWSEMRQNKQERSGEEEKKNPSDKVQTSQGTLCLPWLGPSGDLHINTPWPPYCNSHTHTCGHAHTPVLTRFTAGILDARCHRLALTHTSIL